jgi:hypothetical protein
MKNLLTYESFLNEGAKITPRKLTREGEDASAWLQKIMRSGTIESMNFEGNRIDVIFEDAVDLSEDIFSLAQKWPTAPSNLDLYIDVMSVNRGKLNMVIFGKSGLSFTL